jgi:Protein kinase domain
MGMMWRGRFDLSGEVMGSQQAATLEPLQRQDPARIGSFSLLGRLGAGAMGRVYLGRSAAGRVVAVKTIRSEFAEEADFQVRFAREVAAARRVSGVFTAAVVAADADAEVPWLATAYVPAPSLDQLVNACGPLPVAAVRWLAAGCAEALESIHNAGLVHRDLKPSNVLVSPDGPRVIDFGVARAAEQAHLSTAHGSVGTPAYMAPEQARDTRSATAASDIFSLGSTMLFAATGHAPYLGDSVTDILVRLATEPPDLSDLPAELVGLISRCLARDPDDRPTPADLLEELSPYVVLDTEHEQGRTVLPAHALALVEQYRQRPLPPPREPEPTGADATFGSHIRPPDRAAGRGARKPAARRRRATGRPGGMSRGGRITPVIGSAGAVVGLILLGGVLNSWLGHPGQTQAQGLPPQAGSPTVTITAPDGGRGGPPVPQGPPPGTKTDAPELTMNQPGGDTNTTFTVHGAGWHPGTPLTLALNGHASPYRPIPDVTGSFNYTLNQAHEFFPAGLPGGTLEITVTGQRYNGGTPQTLHTTVNVGGPPPR